MTVGFIGAGKVGFTLGKYFAVNGIEISGYYSQSYDSAEKAADFTESRAFNNIGGLVRECDVIFITTPDSSIKDIYLSLIKYDIKGKQICHCSGALSVKEAFPEIKKYWAEGYSIHPLFPVSDKYNSYKEIGSAYFSIEGDELHINEWRIFFEKLGNPVKILSSEHKTEYHAACAIASNLVCAVIEESIEMMTKCGFTSEQALCALTPLISANISNIIKTDPVTALTGPVERCDCETVSKHMGCFESDTDRELYRAVSLKLITLAQKKHPDTDYSQLIKILDKNTAP